MHKWAELARQATSGYICTMKFPIHKGEERASKQDVKTVWEIVEKVKVEMTNGKNQNWFVQIGGGKGKEPKTTWEEAYYEALLESIC